MAATNATAGGFMALSWKVLCFAAVSLVATGAARAADSVPATAPSNPAVPKPEAVCRHQEPPTGTRLGSRTVCKSQQEWDEIDAANRDALRDHSLRQLQGPADHPMGKSGI
jgi:hypothetical protein